MCVCLQFMAAGFLAVEVQRKANKLKVNACSDHLKCGIFTDCARGKCSSVFTHLEQIIGLIGLNTFSLLLGFSALLANSIMAKQPVAFSTAQQVSLLFFVLLNMLLTLKGSTSSSRFFESVIVCICFTCHNVAPDQGMCVLCLIPVDMRALYWINSPALPWVFSSVWVQIF